MRADGREFVRTRRNGEVEDERNVQQVKAENDDQEEEEVKTSAKKTAAKGGSAGTRFGRGAYNARSNK